MRSRSAGSCGFKLAKARKILQTKLPRRPEMDAFFISSRKAADENSPQFQMRVKSKRAESRRDERILLVIFSVAPAGA
jgi:hypothetical protein